jgi:hypothetical protein
MHKFPSDGGDGWAEVALTFYAATSPDEPDVEQGAGGYPYQEDAPFDRPARVGNAEMWLLDVEGTRVAIVLDSYPDTDPALVDEARAVIESIVVEPTDSGHRLVFRLLAGWDSG